MFCLTEAVFWTHLVYDLFPLTAAVSKSFIRMCSCVKLCTHNLPIMDLYIMKALFHMA